MKTYIKRIIFFVLTSFRFCIFLANLLIKGKYRNLFKNNFSGKVAVLATGPSLKEVLPQLLNNDAGDTDFFALNFFAFNPSFFLLKPKHYCLADPMYFRSSYRDDEVFKLFDIFENQVDWDLHLYVSAQSIDTFLQFSKLKNNHLHIKGVNTFEYKGFESLRFFFYKNKLAMPRPQTVTNMAIYIAINLGYSECLLYGVEHSFLSSLSVNENNELCQCYSHFYDNEVVHKPLRRTEDNTIWKIGDYIIAVGHMFKSHDLLAAYANNIGVRILNCTHDSLIDSYERVARRKR